MKILDVVLGGVIFLILLSSVINERYYLPEQIVHEYEGWIVTDKVDVYLWKFMNVSNDTLHEQFVASDLIYNEWALGDTVGFK